jgi:hypothetical protein
MAGLVMKCAVFSIAVIAGLLIGTPNRLLPVAFDGDAHDLDFE